MRHARCLAVLLALASVTVLASREASAALSDVIREAQTKAVKIHGAGGYRGLESYQSGFVISADGHVLTAWSYVLDTDRITVTLHNGQKHEAKLLGIDPRLELAVLKIEANEVPAFDLTKPAEAGVGTRVLAFSNLYGVATGDEPVSVLHGVVTATVPLTARRGAFSSPYQGPVYVLDAMTNNPGAAGGLLTDFNGELLGVLGKELRSERNNTWLNYAIPAREIVESMQAIIEGRAAPAPSEAEPTIENPIRLADLGIVLVPNVLERTPPFVDQVRLGSPAAEAGVQADDLIVFVDEELVQSTAALHDELAKTPSDAELQLTLIRGNEIVQVRLLAEPATP